MAVMKAVWKPRMGSGGVSVGANVAIGASGTGNITVEPGIVVKVTVTASMFARFSTGASTAVNTDALLAPNVDYEFDLGPNFNTVNFLGNGTAGVASVMSMDRS